MRLKAIAVLSAGAWLALATPTLAVPLDVPSEPGLASGDTVTITTAEGDSLAFRGHVREADGTAVPGARVTVVAWPAGLDRLDEGESFALTEVGTAIADKSGAFELDADVPLIIDISADARIPKAKWQTALPVDLEVLAETDNGIAVYANTVFVQPDTRRVWRHIAFRDCSPAVGWPREFTDDRVASRLPQRMEQDGKARSELTGRERLQGLPQSGIGRRAQDGKVLFAPEVDL